MKRIPQHVIQNIVSQTDIVKLIGGYIRLEKRGSNWLGLCPFHNEKTPSFTVNPDKGFFYCFGCKKGGDVVTFIKEMEKCTYVEAMQTLAEKAGISIHYDTADDPAEEEAASHKNALYELYERLTATFRHFLAHENAALDYTRRRAISDNSIERFKLGYAPKDRTWLHRFLLSKSYSKAFLAETGLFSKNYPDSCIFSDRLMFPITDIRGRVIAFGGRLLGSEGPKYINSPETAIFKKHETLFGFFEALKTIRHDESAIVCEGYMDTIAFHAAGAANAVAPLGTAFTETQASLLKRYAKTLILCFDNDAAGTNATDRAIGIALKQGLAARVLTMSGGKDPAEILEKNGAEQLKSMTEFSITVEEYILKHAAVMAQEGGSVSVAKAFTYSFAYARQLPSDVERDTFLDTAAERLGADPKSVRSDYTRFVHTNTGYADTETAQAAEKPKSAIILNMELELIAALAAHMDMFGMARTELSAADFDNKLIRDIFITMEECFRGDSIRLTDILEHIDNEGAKDYILKKNSLGAYSINPERFIKDAILSIKEKSIKRKRKSIVAHIRTYNHSHDADEISMNDLLCEKMFLDDQLSRIKEERHE